MKTKLFVGNLSRSTHEDELIELFSKAGQVESIELLAVGPPENLKCFAFIDMENRSEAENAIRLFNGYMIDQKTIKVNLAHPREALPAEGGWYADHGPKNRSPRKSDSQNKSMPH